MIVIEGTIESIKPVQNNFNRKAVLTVIQEDNKKCFVEFRGRTMMDVAQPYSVGDKIRITADIEGKTSNHSGVNYNNIVARNIKTIV